MGRHRDIIEGSSKERTGKTAMKQNLSRVKPWRAFRTRAKRRTWIDIIFMALRLGTRPLSTAALLFTSSQIKQPVNISVSGS